MSRGPNPDLGTAILRVALGVVYVTHGSHKLFGSGVGSVAEAFAGLGIPLETFFAWLVTILEVGGGLALILGWMTSAVALLFVIEMGLGIILVHASSGWFVVGPGQGGTEYNVVLIAGLLALILSGPGAAAVDRRRAESEIRFPPPPGEGEEAGEGEDET